MKFYLAGAIDKAADAGVGWRRRATEFLAALGHSTLDPTTKAGEGPESITRRKRLKAAGDFATVTKEMAEIKRLDLKMIDACDCVLAKIDPAVPACGTWFEVCYARSRSIPVVILIDLSTAHDWLFAENFRMYQTLEEFANALGARR
jgi:nucleoside 2-deoxyribosyltransferase